MRRTIELLVALLLFLLGVSYSAAGQANDQAAKPLSPRDQPGPNQGSNPNPSPGRVTLKVTGLNLRDNADSPIGRIEDLIIDPNSGRIEFVIVSTYFPTNSTKLTPVPWKALTPRAEQSRIINAPGANQIFALNFPRTKLQQAPTFERYRWPDMSQADWRQRINQFYGEAGAGGGTGNEDSDNTGSDAGGAGPGNHILPKFGPAFIGPRLPPAQAR
jgi:hypothetical protein